MTKTILFGMTAVTLLTASAAFAAPTNPSQRTHVGFVGEVDLEFGGDSVATVSFVDGSKQEVHAGQGATLDVGFHVRPANWPVDIATTVGYKYVGTKASNANINIGRTVFQILAIYDPKDSWWGAVGPVWHNDVKFDADGFGRNVDLGNAAGFTAQVGWKWFGLGYTNMHYTEQTTGQRNKFDASAIGLSFRWRS